MSNEKQMGLGVMQYTQDYDEKLPPMYDGVNNSNIGGWYYVIQPYMKSTQIFYCPSDTGVDPSQGLAGLAASNVSYGWNFVYLTLDACTPANYDCGGVSLASINATSQTILLGDRTNTDPGQKWALSWNGYPPAVRHLEGGDMCFVDGHVKWFKIPGVLTVDSSLWNTTGAP